MLERIPFDVAISDPKLLKTHWDTLSAPQQTVLKIFNGLPLSGDPHPRSARGFSELDYWALFQGQAEFDELGFPTRVGALEYRPKKYDTLVGILGRRSGKTDRIASTQMAYEAILGGHMRFVEPGQDVMMLFIAQDIEMAASHLNFIYNALRSSPLLLKEVKDKNQDAIVLKNGLKIVPAPPTIKSSRGLAVPGWCADETGFWYTDSKAANPDYEVERAVEYAMAQFPDAFKFVTSTPYTKEGMLYDYSVAGTEGSKLPSGEDREEYEGVLVVHAPTAAMENPRVPRKRLVKLQKNDPEAFTRESLARFVDSISGFLQPELVRLAMTPLPDDGKLPTLDGTWMYRERRPRAGHPEDGRPYYVATMDPAFRHDKFAFSIQHHDAVFGIVQDFFKEWTPAPPAVLNPADILDEIKLFLHRYGIEIVYSDQYQLESLQQLASDRGFTIIGVDFTASSKAKIYGSMKQLVNNRRLRLLNYETIYEQLVALEKKNNPNGSVSIAARPGKYDDAAAVVALGAHQSVWFLPAATPQKPKQPSLLEQGLDAIRRGRAAREADDDGG